MESTREEQRAVIKFLLEEGEKPVNVVQGVESQFGDACMACRTFYNRVGRFRDDRTHVFKMSLTLTWPNKIKLLKKLY